MQYQSSLQLQALVHPNLYVIQLKTITLSKNLQKTPEMVSVVVSIFEQSAIDLVQAAISGINLGPSRMPRGEHTLLR